MRGCNVMRLASANPRKSRLARRGAATLDYVLILGTFIPLAGICLSLGRRIILSAYEMISVLIGSPFL